MAASTYEHSKMLIECVYDDDDDVDDMGWNSFSIFALQQATGV